MQAEYAYDAYGNCTITNSTNSNLANYNPIRYRSYYYDRETGLYYLNSRYYNPQWRRFISPDDTGYIDPENINGLNLYAYCGNDPVNYSDPSGHSVTALIIIGIGAIVGLLVGTQKVVAEDKKGWDAVGTLVGGMLIGAAAGALLASGIAAFSAGLQVLAGVAIAKGTIAMFTTGLLAFNLFAVLAAPFLEMEVEPISPYEQYQPNLPNNKP